MEGELGISGTEASFSDCDLEAKWGMAGESSVQAEIIFQAIIQFLFFLTIVSVEHRQRLS